MKKFEEKDDERESRIQDEVVVDCYDEYEQAAGWETYLGDKLNFPFKAKRIGEHGGSQVNVLGMSEIDSMKGIFVEVELKGEIVDLPVEQIEPIAVDEETREGIEDWHYWIAQGHQF